MFTTFISFIIFILTVALNKFSSNVKLSYQKGYMTKLV